MISEQNMAVKSVITLLNVRLKSTYNLPLAYNRVPRRLWLNDLVKGVAGANFSNLKVALPPLCRQGFLCKWVKNLETLHFKNHCSQYSLLSPWVGLHHWKVSMTKLKYVIKNLLQNKKIKLTRGTFAENIVNAEDYTYI